MKKLFPMLLCAVYALGAQAQLVTSTSETITVNKEEKKGYSQWIARVGLGINGTGEEIGDFEDGFGPRLGYFIGVEFNKVGERGIYYGLDLALTNRGYMFTERRFNEQYNPNNQSSQNSQTVKYGLSAHSFEFSPVIVGWKINLADSKVAIDPHIGMFMSIDYTGKFTYESSNTSRTVNIWDQRDYWPMELGLRYGVGFWFFEKYNIDITYQHGFMGFEKDFDSITRGFYARLSYAF